MATNMILVYVLFTVSSCHLVLDNSRDTSWIVIPEGNQWNVIAINSL